jgi:hypothetical protein
MSQEPAVTAIARSRGTRRGVAGTALLVLAADQASKSLVMTASPPATAAARSRSGWCTTAGRVSGSVPGTPWSSR